MNKKIWRGHQFGDGVDGKQVSESTMWGEKFNATIIPDAACFPVKEAMAFIKKAESLGRGWFHVYPESVAAEEWNAMGDAFDKYLAAVERMKKKAKVKK